MPSNLPLPALVIPDVHHRCDWAEAVIATEGADCASIIFTGDYFDHHGDTPLDTLHTARWLKKSLKDKRRTHLLGNHDVAYFARGVQTAEWSGWSDHKQEVFARIFPAESFTELPLHLAATAGPWLLSHAGFCGGKLSPLVDHPTQALLHWAGRRPTSWRVTLVRLRPRICPIARPSSTLRTYTQNGARMYAYAGWPKTSREPA